MSPNRGRLLLTGASGFLGRAAAAALECKGWSVIRAVRDCRDSSAVALDLTRVQDLARLAELHDVAAIAHLAATVDLGAAALADLFSTNVSPVGVLAALARSGKAHLVMASTVLVGNSPTLMGPGSAYVRSKELGERLVEASGANATILRFPGIFGWNGPAHLGLNRAITAAVQGTAPTIVGEGRGRRNYIYVGDAATQIAHALEHRVVGTHVVAGSEEISIREMLEAVCEAFLPGLHPERVTGPEAADQVFVPSAAFPPTRSFRAALADIRAGTR